MIHVVKLKRDKEEIIRKTPGNRLNFLQLFLCQYVDAKCKICVDSVRRDTHALLSA